MNGESLIISAYPIGRPKYLTLLLSRSKWRIVLAYSNFLRHLSLFSIRGNRRVLLQTDRLWGDLVVSATVPKQEATHDMQRVNDWLAEVEAVENVSGYNSFSDCGEPSRLVTTISYNPFVGIERETNSSPPFDKRR